MEVPQANGKRRPAAPLLLLVPLPPAAPPQRPRRVNTGKPGKWPSRHGPNRAGPNPLLPQVLAYGPVAAGRRGQTPNGQGHYRVRPNNVKTTNERPRARAASWTRRAEGPHRGPHRPARSLRARCLSAWLLWDRHGAGALALPTPRTRTTTSRAATLKIYRFSAFWLRSKCSICSYQLNIWYTGHCPVSILN